MKQLLVLLLLLGMFGSSEAQDSLMMRRMANEILLNGQCYDDLRELCKTIGHRLSGTPQAAKAIVWAQKKLEDAGADRVWLQPVDVTRWVRGKESLKVLLPGSRKYVTIPMLSLGNSQGTDSKVLEANVVMVKSFEHFKKMKDDDIKGNIIFFNYHFRQDLINTFEGYGDAGPYRWYGPNMASARGAAGVIIRSVSTGMDDAPHTGSMRYADTVNKIPAIAIGNKSADMLEQQCKLGFVSAQIQSECRIVDTVRSYNVIGEITGRQHPEQIVLVGGHLDSWDVGEGAHDDGAGCVEAIETIRTLKKLNIHPNRTIRAVLFMNEENGTRGGVAYADSAKAKKEKHIIAFESDAGGFAPRGIGFSMDAAKHEYIKKAYSKLFLPYGVYDFDRDEGGADIYALNKQGVPAAGMLPDPQRYFDLHHTANDVFEQVNHRELKLGAFTMTAFAWLMSEYGL